MKAVYNAVYQAVYKAVCGWSPQKSVVSNGRGRTSAYGKTFSLVAVAAFTMVADQGEAQTAPVVLDQAQTETISSETRQSRATEGQQLVSLDGKERTILESVRELARQAGKQVGFNRSDTVLQSRKTVKLQQVPLNQALGVVLAGTSLSFRMTPDGKTIVLGPTPSETPRRMPSQDSNVVTGRVLDSATENGLRGVTVTVRGTSVSGITDASGDFVVRNVPTGEITLDFKLLGYVSAARTVTVSNGKPTAVPSIKLRQNATMLSGVVTTATGEQKKLEVGHSIVTLNVDSLLKVAPVSNLTDLLESRVPGMTVQRTSGSPGDPSRIRLRGTNSINSNNDPILVVDGIRVYSETSDGRNTNGGASGLYATPSSFDQIDVNSIETVEVLRGPSAAALYGSDAANGVIIVTTKRGRAGPAVWWVSGDYGLSYFPGKWPTAWYKFVSPRSGGVSQMCWGYCGDVTIDSLVAFQALNDPRSTALGTGSTSSGSISVSGGSQNTRYNVTLSAGNQLGVLRLPRFDQERYLFYQGVPAPGWMKRPDHLDNRSGSIRVDIDVNDKTTVGITTSLSQQLQRRTSMSTQVNSAISQLQEQYVDFTVYRLEPLLGNPYERVTSGTLGLNSGLHINVTPFPWLPITTTSGISTRIQDNEGRIGRDLYPAMIEGAWNGSNKNSTDLTGSANTIIPIASRLNLAVGAQFTRNTTNDQSGRFRGFAVGVTDPASGTLDSTQFSRRTSERKSIGWYIEPRLNIRSRLFVMPGFRLDNNGLQSKNAGFNGLPKINMSWVASDESFFPFEDQIRMLRFRTAFGVAGVQPKPGQGSRLYARQSYNPYDSISETYGDVLILSHVGNASLRPERGVELEGGFDVELWNGRLTFDFTHARTYRKDAIITDKYALSANGGGKGYYGGVGIGDVGSLTMNLGDIRNTNTEIAATVQLIERRAVSVQTSMNLTRSRSKILRLRQDGSGLIIIEDTRASGLRYEVGYPMQATWQRPIIGYADVDGDGFISPYEVSLGDSSVYVGSSDPSFQLNASQNVTLWHGRISLNATWSYTDGALQTRGWEGASRGDLAINAPDVSLGHMAGWVIGGNTYNTSSTHIGRMMIVDVLRLQSFSLSVNLGTNVTKVVRARNASLSIQGRNLGIWTNYAGVDPNVNAYSTGNLTADRGTLPSPREWRLRFAIGW